MTDLERQLAGYGKQLRSRAYPVELDEIHGRLDRSMTRHGPVPAMVAGAALVLASMGVLFLGLAATYLFAPDQTPATPLDAAASPATGPMTMALVAGGGAVIVLGIGASVGLKNRRRRGITEGRDRSRERRKKMMQSLDKPVAPIERLERNNKRLIVALVALSLLAAGLGAWLITENFRFGAEGDIVNLIEDYGAAWEANDGAAVADLMTADGRVLAGNGITYGVDELVPMVNSLGTFNPGGSYDYVIMPRQDYWYVATADEITLDYSTHNSMAIFKVVEQDGEYLIEFHETWRGGSSG